MKVLFKNIRSGKRKAALLDLNSITRRQLERDLDQKVKPALVKSHQLVVAGWDTKIKFGTKKFITANSISINIFPTGQNALIWNVVDKGAKPHKIKAKGGGRLNIQVGKYNPKTLARPARTVSGGGTVQNPQWRSVTEVNHPGSEGRHFSEAIAEDLKPGFVRIIENSFRAVAKECEE